MNAQSDVEIVNFPRVTGSQVNAIAAAQQSGAGFVLSFELRGGKAAADRFVAALELIILASSLGGYSTLVCTPATMTHRGMSPEAQREAGISPSLLRLSIGLEDCDDLVADLQRGFAALSR